MMSDTIPVPADDYAKIVAENIVLRDKLLEIAKECGGCGGTGVVTLSHLVRGHERVRQVPCSDCEDIRAALGQ
jgi:hypothetical protein